MNAESRYPYNLDARSEYGSAQLIQIESGKLVPLLLSLAMFACLISGVSLGFAMWAKSESQRAQTRADLLQVEVESFKNVLHANGLPVAAHLPGESP